MRRAFTMVELIFVIILLGILGVMSTDIISQTYRNYVDQRELSQLQGDSKRTLAQITAYLDDALKPSIALFNGATYADAWDRAGVMDANTTNYLVWLDKDTASQRGVWSDASSRVVPGYSGIADVENSTANAIVTPACDLTTVDTMQSDLSDMAVWSAGGAYRTALYFVYANADGTVQQRFWAAPGSAVFRVSGVTGSNTINLLDAPDQISDQYYLSFGASGLHVVGTTLQLIEGFRPWNGQNVFNGRAHILATDVESFEIWNESEAGLLRLKLCLRNPVTSINGKIVFCREAAVLR